MAQSASVKRGTPSNYIFPAEDDKSWTPNIRGSISDPTLSYTTRAGAYAYFGQYIFATFQTVTGTWTGPGSGNVQFDLPDIPELQNRNVQSAASIIGGGVMWDSSAQLSIGLVPTIMANGKVQFTKIGSASLALADCGSSDQFGFWILIPIKNRSGKVPLLNVKATSPIYAGMVLPWLGSGAVPDGYSEADGGALNQADYPDCFAHYGTSLNTQINPTTGASWGNPSPGQFRKPDLRGVGLRGTGTPVNGSALSVGDYQADQMQGHRHSIPYYNNAGGSAQYLQDFNKTTSKSAVQSDTGSTLDPTTDGGNGTPRIGLETRGKSRGVRWMVKLFNESFNPLAAPIAANGNGGFVEYANRTKLSTAFIFNGTGVTAGPVVDVIIERLGKTVTVTIPASQAPTGSGSNDRYSNVNLFPEWARPLTDVFAGHPLIQNAGTVQAGVGVCRVTAAGQYYISRDATGLVWTASSSGCGLAGKYSFSYNIE